MITGHKEKQQAVLARAGLVRTTLLQACVLLLQRGGLRDLKNVITLQQQHKSRIYCVQEGGVEVVVAGVGLLFHSN